MITVITHELLATGDVGAILESTGAEYVHVSSKAKKVSVINLGMDPQQFKAFNSSSALNVFGKQFKPATVEKLGTDVCVFSDGTLTTDEFTQLAEKAKALIGKVPLVGIGIGKEILMAATEADNGWTPEGSLWTHSATGCYGIDDYSQLSVVSVL